MGRLDLQIKLEKPSPRNYEFNEKEEGSSSTPSPGITAVKAEHVISKNQEPKKQERHTTGVRNQTSYDVAGIFKDMDLYLAAKDGNDTDFHRVLCLISIAENASFEQILSRISPAGNTLVHVAVKHGKQNIIRYIATNYPILLSRKNINGDTALHVASKAGDESMVKQLVPTFTDLQDLPSGADLITARNSLVKEQNMRGNTALHEALLHNRKLVAEYLVHEHPEILYYRNHEGESALYIAAKAGLADIVSSILEIPTDQKIINENFRDKSPIHAAIMMKSRGVLEAILNRKPGLIQIRDNEGRTPLHIAVSLGYLEEIRFLLERYAPIANFGDKTGICPIHVASFKGHIDIIILLLQYCPAPEELLDKHGRNILHIAANNGRSCVVRFILNNPNLEELINMKDLQGNSPLHLATMAWHPKIVSALTWDKRVDVNLVNNKGMTALDAAEFHMSESPPFCQRLTWTALKSAGTPRSLFSKVSRRPPNINHIMQLSKERINTLLLVSTLVATVTFAAGFTMPGGYDSSTSDLGMATMVREGGFHIFVFCDTIAMHCSIIADVVLIYAQLGDPNLVLTTLNVALPLLGIALSSMAIAFTAGISVVVSKHRWLCAAVSVLGYAFMSILVLLFFPLCMPYTSNNRILRYISYYPFRLMILASRS